jgi:hypothetical protein
MDLVGTVGSATIILNSEIFVVPSGARTIDLINTGGADGSFKGNRSIGSKSPVFVGLGAGLAYSFGDLGKPYGEITIDATGTTIEATINY